MSRLPILDTDFGVKTGYQTEFAVGQLRAKLQGTRTGAEKIGGKIQGPCVWIPLLTLKLDVDRELVDLGFTIVFIDELFLVFE